MSAILLILDQLQITPYSFRYLTFSWKWKNKICVSTVRET